ncbi:hypothetical protein HDU79_011515 [Rhizoclosmatium sp. JEL0117]|nr:hypothetical protein HDU79_011515 [Rhizoclosmatium sp. JEL0117]
MSEIQNQSVDAFLAETAALFDSTEADATASSSNLTSAFDAFKHSLGKYIRENNMSGKQARRDLVIRARRFATENTNDTRNTFVVHRTKNIGRENGGRVCGRQQRGIIQRIGYFGFELRVLEAIAEYQAPIIRERQQRLHAATVNEARELFMLGLY